MISENKYILGITGLYLKKTSKLRKNILIKWGKLGHFVTILGLTEPLHHGPNINPHHHIITEPYFSLIKWTKSWPMNCFDCAYTYITLHCTYLNNGIKSPKIVHMLTILEMFAIVHIFTMVCGEQVEAWYLHKQWQHKSYSLIALQHF